MDPLQCLLIAEASSFLYMEAAELLGEVEGEGGAQFMVIKGSASSQDHFFSQVVSLRRPHPPPVNPLCLVYLIVVVCLQEDASIKEERL